MPFFARHVLLMCVLLAGGAMGQARAETARARLLLPKGSQVQLAVLRDGFHVGLLVDHLDAHAAHAALAPLHAQSMTIEPFGHSSLLTILRFDEPVLRARASLAKDGLPRAPKARLNPSPQPTPSASASAPAPSAAGGESLGAPLVSTTAAGQVASATVGDGNERAAARGKKVPHLHVDIDIELSEPLPRLLEHAMAGKLPLPATLEHHRLWDAETAFASGRVGEAELMLTGLKPHGPFAAWVAVRLGDVAAYHGDAAGACAKYAQAQGQSELRVPAQLAALRSRVLRCTPAGKVDWKPLLSRAGRDDPVGRNMSAEARWALQSERDPNTLDAVLTQSGVHRGDGLPPDLYDALAARNLRLREPMAMVLAAQRLPLLQNQDEAFDLALELGDAWCALDVPQQWHPPSLRLRSWVHGDAHRKQARIEAVRRCRGLDDPAHVRALSKASPPELERTLRQLEARTKVAAAAAQARAALLRPPRPASSTPAVNSAAPAPAASAPPKGGP